MDCDGSADQIWWVHDVNGSFIQNSANALCMDIEGAKRPNGTRIILWDCDTTWKPWNQKFAVGMSVPQGFVQGGLPNARGRDLSAQFASGSASIIAAGAGNVLVVGGNVISTDGASLVGNDGASIIAAQGLSLIGNDGAGLIGNDGAGIISGGAGN